MKTNILVISTSLNSESKSRILAKEALNKLNESVDYEWLDLQEFKLPLCDGATAYGHEHVPIVKEKIEKADGIILSIPIYNFASGSSAKNLIELTGRAWSEKTVGFLCAAGGKSSYMSVMSLANSLMLDFRSIIVPSFVYADGSCFEGDDLADKDIESRIKKLVDQVIKISSSLK